MLPAACPGGGAGMTAELKPGTSPVQEPRPPQESDGWRILSYMLGGMILYGGIGWLVSRWTGIAVLFPAGMILGIGLSIAMVIFRFTRS
jgi:F0F1-type ATP synthase assembly protein I